MPEVKKSRERKFFSDLKNLFKPLVGEIKEKGESLEQLEERTRNYLTGKVERNRLRNTIANMVMLQRADSLRAMREEATRRGAGRKFAERLAREMDGAVGNRVREIIADNVKYIHSVTTEWAEFIPKYALNMTLEGHTQEEIEAGLREILPEHMQTKLRTIARTECAKANAAIVQARCEMCGVRAYIWRCVRDERTRGAHRSMSGVLIFYNDPPNPEALYPIARGHGKPPKPYGNYHAGNTYNCRCYQEPVLDMKTLPDIIRVHDHGRIVAMTPAQIRSRFGRIA